MVAAVTVVLAFFATRLEVDADLVNMIPESSEVKHLTEKYGQANTTDSHALLIFMAPDLFTASRLALVADACTRIETVEHVKSSITPFNFLTFENRGGRLVIGTTAPGGRTPATDEEARALRERLLADPQARNLVISRDGDALCAIFSVESIKNRTPILEDIEAIIAPLGGTVDARVVGGMPVNRAMMRQLYADLPVFLGLALVLILVSYYLSFRTWRSHDTARARGGARRRVDRGHHDPAGVQAVRGVGHHPAARAHPRQLLQPARAQPVLPRGQGERHRPAVDRGFGDAHQHHDLPRRDHHRVRVRQPPRGIDTAAARVRRRHGHRHHLLRGARALLPAGRALAAQAPHRGAARPGARGVPRPLPRAAHPHGHARPLDRLRRLGRRRRRVRLRAEERAVRDELLQVPAAQRTGGRELQPADRQVHGLREPVPHPHRARREARLLPGPRGARRHQPVRDRAGRGSRRQVPVVVRRVPAEHEPGHDGHRRGPLVAAAGPAALEVLRRAVDDAGERSDGHADEQGLQPLHHRAARLGPPGARPRLREQHARHHAAAEGARRAARCPRASRPSTGGRRSRS